MAELSATGRYDLFLSFEESVFGGKRDVDFTHFQTCDNCNGTGAKSSSSIKSCSECGGRGAVLNTQRTPFGVVSQVTLLKEREITTPTLRVSYFIFVYYVFKFSLGKMHILPLKKCIFYDTESLRTFLMSNFFDRIFHNILEVYSEVVCLHGFVLKI